MFEQKMLLLEEELQTLKVAPKETSKLKRKQKNKQMPSENFVEPINQPVLAPPDGFKDAMFNRAKRAGKS